MTSRVLVTGGAGYIGSHTVKLLCDRGYRVTVLDNLSAGHRAAVDRRAELVVGDILDRALVKSVLRRGVDGVIHFAASLSVAESVREPLLYWRNNLGGTVELLSAMREEGVKRIVFSSTAATYGIPQSPRIDEHAAQSPINPYGRSKLAMERAIQDCVEAYGFGAVSLRYFNAAGAAADGSLGEDHRPEEHLIPVVLEVALGKRKQVKIFGTDFKTPDGTCVRDFIHVDDLAEAHRLAFDSTKPGDYRAFNVATGTGHSVREVIAVARKITGHEIPALEAERRAGDPPELVADPTLILRSLNWSPKLASLEAIIGSAWSWHRAHPSGYPD